jgi:nitrous oxide reductase accessory protein NosL
MPFPKTADEMKATGYEFQNDAVCKGCGSDIEWWKSPKGNMVPMDPMPRGSSEAVAHFSTCPDASTFRRK